MVVARRTCGLGVVVLAAVLTGSGCYHAIVDTGRSQSGTTIETPWAHSFIYGLVPPAMMNVAQDCPNGVARVETQHSFLNGLAAAITFGIYTPMTITAHCAASGSPEDAQALLTIPADATGEEARRMLTDAVRTSARTGHPFYVRLLAE